MTNYKLDVTSDIRKYLWAQLKQHNVFDRHDYFIDSLDKEIIPIIPVQQQPELNQFLSGKKHIVYDKIKMSYDDLWAICDEQILFCIYATDISEINEIRNLMVDLFRRMDESARDVNRSGEISNTFKFHTITMIDISPVSPSEEIQGFLGTDIVLEVKYSRESNSAGRFI
jgi:hypothetical protein